MMIISIPLITVSLSKKDNLAIYCLSAHYHTAIIKNFLLRNNGKLFLLEKLRAGFENLIKKDSKS